MVRRTLFAIAMCFMICVSHGIPNDSWADDAGSAWVSRVISIQGHVLVKRQGENDWRPAGLDDPLYAGDQIRVEAKSRAGIVLSNDTVLRLTQIENIVGIKDATANLERGSDLLRRAPEGFAVYSGEDASRVWPAPQTAEPLYFQR